MKNIGGSIFPSSNPEILQPIPFKGGNLQVIADYFTDTHYLYFDNEKIASHPNGYSCHSLAKRIFAENPEEIIEQADYIIRCGGTCNFDILKKIQERP